MLHFPRSSISHSNKFLDRRKGLREPQHTPGGSEVPVTTRDYQLGSAWLQGGWGVLWDWALHLRDLMLTPGRYCRNQTELQDTQLELLKIACSRENPTKIWWPGRASEVKFSLWVVKETHTRALFPLHLLFITWKLQLLSKGNRES